MRIPLPQKGQPLDITYINTLVSAINSLSDSVAADKIQSFGYDGKLQTTAAHLGLDSGYMHISKSGEPTKVTDNFVVPFIEPPLIVATVSAGGGGLGYTVRLSIAARTASSVTFDLSWTDETQQLIDIHWIAIGLTRA